MPSPKSRTNAVVYNGKIYALGGGANDGASGGLVDPASYVYDPSDNTWSVLAAHPVPSHFATHAYAAVKGAEISLTTAMASYYASDGIRANAIAPGLIRTPMAERAAEDPVIVDYAARKQPLAGGLIEAHDVAEAAAFLLSDRSRQITGQVLAVDGGWSVVESAP